MQMVGVLGAFFIFLIAYKREESINSLISKNNFIKRSAPFVVCFFISFLLALRFDLSPFNTELPEVDSSVFLYIGRSMYNGAVPYRDLFDHKGIVLYFIEYLGYLIGFGSKTGVWVIELINIYATALIMFYTARLFTDNNIISYLSTYLVLHVSTVPFLIKDGGNFTEEYALPWIALSLYIVLKFFVTQKYKNWNVIAVGCGFAIVFFLRVNMVGLWAALILCLTIHFIKNKEIAELFKCAFLFLLGCVIVCVPIFIYLITTDSLKEMIEYYFYFNFSYTGSYSKLGIITFLFECINNVGLFVFFILYSSALHYRKKVVWVNLVTLAFAYLSATISGRQYPHYAIIIIPFFVVPTVLTIIPLMQKMREVLEPIKKKNVFASVVAICLMCVALDPAYSFFKTLKTVEIYDPVYKYVTEKTSENDDVLFLGPGVNYYIVANRQTKNKFIYQWPPIEISDKLCQEFLSELQSNPSDYIIIKERSYVPYKVRQYLDGECENGTYQFEKYDDFQVYVRTEEK